MGAFSASKGPSQPCQLEQAPPAPREGSPPDCPPVSNGWVSPLYRGFGPTPANRTLKPRMGKSEEVAAVALHLASLSRPVPCCVCEHMGSGGGWSCKPPLLGSGHLRAALGNGNGNEEARMLSKLGTWRPLPPRGSLTTDPESTRLDSCLHPGEAKSPSPHPKRLQGAYTES